MYHTTGDWFMTIIKRCEKEVPGTWVDKQQQATVWLEQFVPHYTRRCLPDGGCPARHSSVDDDSKRWLDDKNAVDKTKIDQLLQLIDRMKADVSMYIHGYNTCAVECAHSERTVLTSKRIEYWVNWEGKCRLVQLLHNHRTRTTGESLLRELGWEVMNGVSTQLGKIDRDKAKHHQIKTAAAYNARQKAIRVETKERDMTDGELIARAEKRKQKTRAKAWHYYSAKKQLLYEEKKKKEEGGEEKTKGVEVDAAVVKKKRGRPRKNEAEKENDEPAMSSSPSEMTKRKRVDALATVTAAGNERPVLNALVMNGAVGVNRVFHSGMQGVVMMTTSEW
jgi:hypothetical protein